MDKSIKLSLMRLLVDDPKDRELIKKTLMKIIFDMEEADAEIKERITPTEKGATPTEKGATPTEKGATPTKKGASELKQKSDSNKQNKIDYINNTHAYEHIFRILKEKLPHLDNIKFGTHNDYRIDNRCLTKSMYGYVIDGIGRYYFFLGEIGFFQKFVDYLYLTMGRIIDANFSRELSENHSKKLFEIVTDGGDVIDVDKIYEMYYQTYDEN